MQNNTKTKQKDNFWQSQSCPLTPNKLITLIVRRRGSHKLTMSEEMKSQIYKSHLYKSYLFSLSLARTLCVYGRERNSLSNRPCANLGKKIISPTYNYLTQRYVSKVSKYSRYFIYVEFVWVPTEMEWERDSVKKISLLYIRLMMPSDQKRDLRHVVLQRCINNKRGNNSIK